MEKLERLNGKKGTEENKSLRYKPEILAPAGSMEALRAALCAGADAVYIGGQSFGARAFADNPDKDELLAAISYVHLRRKRLYLTVNTLIKEQEFNAFYEFLAPFYATGLDAAIVQDVGAMRFIAKEFPGLSIHASTQMTLTGAGGLSFFDNYPVTRLVPARELSLSELSALCSSTKREVEVFVHGALCYCYSGQCLMSSLIGGRSGNRGRCAQPCRMEYQNEEGKSGYFLSPKDLCGLTVLPELVETGAASFKIEGRMKRPEYAAAVAAAYREGVDLYDRLGAKGYREYCASHPDFIEKKVEELSDIYNRGGFTTGCFQKKNGPELMSMRRPGHYGVLVGTVTADTVGKAELTLSEDVSAQDVLEFRKKNGAKDGIPAYYEFTLGLGAKCREKLSARMLPKLKAQKGDLVYRMKNAALLERIAQSYVKTEDKVPVSGRFFAKAGEACRLELSATCLGLLPPVPFAEPSPEKVTVCVEGFVCETAGKLPATEEAVKKQLGKTGNEAFYFDTLLVELADAVFLPNGKLNELRRAAFAKLYETMQSAFVRTKKEDGNEKDKTMQQEIASDQRVDFYWDCVVRTKEQARAAAGVTRVRRIYTDFAESFGPSEKAAFSELHRSGKEVFFCLPHICRPHTLERLQRELAVVSEYTDGYLVRNLEGLTLLCGLETEREKTIVLDSNLYIMNREAKEVYREFFGKRRFELTAPFELSEKELKALDISRMNFVVYGRILLMVSTHCVKKNTKGCRPEASAKPITLKDRVGKNLPVQCICRDCYNLIYNPEVLNLLTEEKAIAGLSPRALRLDFTFEEPELVKRLLEKGFTDGAVGAGYTRGHFKRGVE